MADSASGDFGARVAVDAARVEERLGVIVETFASHHSGMAEAIAYSLLGGGKRLRPILCIWTHDAAGGARPDAVLDIACAIECVHTYSLVHDDLPCMDDDDLRRGRPSSHRRFDCATAVLVGDALQNLAHEILSTLPSRDTGVDPGNALECVRILSRSAGTAGLIAGQALDLAPPATDSVEDRLERVERIQENKTARLFSASMELGAVAAGTDETTRRRVAEAGLRAGEAFQIADDLLDIEKDEETLGKTPGKDIKSGKLTYPSVVGLEGARSRARDRIEAALGALPDTEGYEPIRWLLRHLVERGA